MNVNEYKVAGFIFSEPLEYKEAKREAESIEYIKANTDLNDLNKAVKLYHKLIERNTLRTVVGYAFLKELQERIIKEGIIGRENIPCIRVDQGNQFQRSKFVFSSDENKKHQLVIKEYKIRIRNSRIISFFLVGIIVLMFLISIFSKNSSFINHENDILDKYSAWEEELNNREAELKERENILKGN